MNRRQLLAALGFSPALFSQAEFNEERIWSDYLDWLAKNPQKSFLGLIDYRRKLAADGLPEAAIEMRMAVISKRVYTRTEGMRLWFNEVYSSNNGFYTERPNAFLMQAVREMHPGTALDVSMGQGRNSVYLARVGWDVTGFDVSDEGLARAQKNAERAGVHIKTVLQGYQDFDFGVGRWDLIALIYAFFPVHDPAFIEKVIKSLRPGGTVVLESRLRTDRHPEGDYASLIGITGPNELLRIFGRLRILFYEETVGTPDFGGKSAELVRMIARG